MIDLKRIYLDHAATTPVDRVVLLEMLPYLTRFYGNASSLHTDGIKAYEAIEKARERVANILKGEKNEIIFTSGGTESNNLALKGVAYINRKKIRGKGPHIITSSIEHPSVLEVCKSLEKEGFKVKYVPVDRNGIVNVDDIERSITKDTFLISIMLANNEIGTIQPIREIGKIANEKDILLHTDTIQAIGKIKIDVDKMNIDLLSISGHKIYAPKGVGALYIKEGVRLTSILHGGGHEKNLRSGTENVPGIVALGKACELAEKRMEKDVTHMKNLRDKLIKGILSSIEESYLNGHPKKRLPNNAHFRFTAIEGESLIMGLDENGISASTGSACSSKKLQPSHVLIAIGLTPVEAHGSLRLTLGRKNTKEEIDYVIGTLPKVVDKLREISPLWKK